MSKILDLVNKFNDGEWEEFSNIFGDDIGRFLFTVRRSGFLDYLDLDSVNYNDDSLVNEIMLYRLNEDPSYINTIVQNYLSDVEIRDDGYYLRLRDLTELSEFFEDNRYSRNYNDRKVVEGVLGEDWWEPYSDTVHDVYKDIVEELNERNMKLLAERVLELVGNQELSLDDYESELFRDMSDDDGRFIITESNVMSVVEDEDSMNQLFNGDLNDLKNQLRWLGDEAYNQAYTDEVYQEVFNQLSTYFEGRHDWVTTKKGEKTVYTPYIKIKDISNDVGYFLENFKGGSDNLYSFDSYTGMLTQWMYDRDEYLKIRIPDYPDDRKVVENINDGFPDRLYG
jgi:hypothetical protein